MTAFEKIFNSRFRYLLLAWLIIVLFVTVQMGLVGFYKPEMHWPLNYYIFFFIKQLILGIVFIHFYVIPIYDLIKKIKSTTLKILSFFGHGFVFGTLLQFIVSFLNELKINNAITPQFKDRFYNLFFTDLHNSIRTYLILIAILFAYDYFRKNTKSIIAQKNLENEMNKVKLESLHAQLQPHFLFNSLHNIVALIDEDKQKSQQALIYLSDLLRYTVNLQPENLVSIAEEIETIKTYLFIEKARHEEKLNVIWEVQTDIKDLKVPPLIAQPLIENSIKHGFKENRNILTLIISITKEMIKISNNGSPLSFPIDKGNGLNLVEKRLEVHFPNRFEFKIKQDKEWIINTIIFHANV
ncbi:MAG: histidine kinase [Bacteroidota bacterium]